MKPITPIQQKIYEFLVEMARENTTPSVREIGAAVGLRSTSSVQASLASILFSFNPTPNRALATIGILTTTICAISTHLLSMP